MSPLIYTRHHCKPAQAPEVETMEAADLLVSTWQCPECQAYWEPKETNPYRQNAPLTIQWVCLGRPEENAHMRAVEAHLEGTSALSATTITPDMVQLVLDTYAEHTERARDVFSGYTGCAVCGAGSYGPHTIRAHARGKAAEALQDALDKAGRDAQE